MNNNVLCGIGKSRPNLFCVVLFNKCTCRTNYCTLTTTDTSNIAEVEFECLTDVSLEASFVSTDNSNFLVLVTNCNAATAKNTT